jgi:hypothetical protein
MIRSLSATVEERRNRPDPPKPQGCTGTEEEVEMAEIVKLQAFAHRRMPRRDRHGVAEIVIFPGVRIDRKTFSLAERLVPGERSVPTSRATIAPAQCDD